MNIEHNVKMLVWAAMMLLLLMIIILLWRKKRKKRMKNIANTKVTITFCGLLKQMIPFSFCFFFLFIYLRNEIVHVHRPFRWRDRKYSYVLAFGNIEWQENNFSFKIMFSSENTFYPFDLFIKCRKARKKNRLSYALFNWFWM